MTNTLLGIFSDRLNAENAITELEAQGFSPKDISIIMKETKNGEKVSRHTGANLAEGAVSGAATGGMMAGLAGLLIGIGVIAIPGAGALLIAGPLATALGLTGVAATTVSAALTGALAGGLVGGLIGLGIPEEEAKVIEGRIKEGGILIAVPVLAEEEPKVRQIFHDFGADMIRAISTTQKEQEVYPQETYGPARDEYPEQAYYSDIKPQRRDDKPTLWQKIKNFFR